MHHFQIKAFWPVWVFLSKEIHGTQIYEIKKEGSNSTLFFKDMLSYNILFVFDLNATV